MFTVEGLVRRVEVEGGVDWERGNAQR